MVSIQAEKLGTKILDEDGLLELIRTHPGKKGANTQNVHKEQSVKKTQEKHKLEDKTEVPPVKRAKFEAPQMKDIPKIPKEEPSICKPIDSDISGGTEMWVDRYKPTALKQVIGQQGDKSNAKKLLNWLSKWNANQKQRHQLSRPSE